MTTLYGPRGEPLTSLGAVSETDEDIEYDDGKQKVVISRTKSLMEMALAQRAGASIPDIIRDFHLVNMGHRGDATDPRTIQRALDEGHRLLREAERQMAERDAAAR